MSQRNTSLPWTTPIQRWPEVLRVTCLAPVLVASTAAAAAVEFGDRIEIHGYGGWAYGNTDGNLYLVGSDDGEYGNAEFTLNVSANPVEKLTLVAQVQLESHRDESDTHLDYAFAEWAFSDALRVRAGRAKHPFGIYAEIFDVGTLRPFYTLPQGIYGPQGITAQSYNGVGLTGSHYGASGWGVQYDVYGGQFEGEIAIPGPLALNPATLLEPAIPAPFRLEDVVGARLNLVAPIAGLTFGFSAYDGKESVVNLESPLDLPTKESYTSYGSHLEYLDDAWSVRAEVSRYETPRRESEGWYAEVGYRLTPNWQVAVRHDSTQAEIPGFLPFFPPEIAVLTDELLSHDDTGMALNYWFNPNLVLRLNYHRVEGNRFAFPDDPSRALAALQSGRLPEKTDLILFGGQFSF
jgi:hypothetical protein